MVSTTRVSWDSPDQLHGFLTFAQTGCKALSKLSTSRGVSLLPSEHEVDLVQLVVSHEI